MSLLASKIENMVECAEPWPHAIIDEFLPPDVFADLIAWLPKVTGDPSWVKWKNMPSSVTGALKGPDVEAAIRQRFGFDGCEPSIEVAYRRAGLKPHADRQDKPWSGLIYLAGDPKGTELYDASGSLTKTVDFIPNRLVCWANRRFEQHAVPVSEGRYVLVWWFLRTHQKRA